MPVAQGRYRIVVHGRLGDGFVDGFEDMTQTTAATNTVLEGPFVDRSHLHGLLDRLRDLGIEIVSFDTWTMERHQ